MSNEGHYKSLVDNLYDGVCFCDLERRVTYWNKGAERIAGFSAAEVVGASCSEGVLTHTDEKGASLCAERCPVQATLADGKPRRLRAFVRHKDGHPIPVEVRTAPLRDDHDRIVGAAQIFTDNSAIVAALQHLDALRRMAYVDSVTGLPNRRHAEPTLRGRLAEMRQYGWEFAVLFLDVDGFKDINERYGHEIGDEVLRLVAQALATNCRSSDFVARWGGDEFVGVLPNIDAEKLFPVAERFRLLVESSGLPLLPAAVRTTVSVGATLARSSDAAEDLIKRADELMFRSKAAGGNRVTIG